MYINFGQPISVSEYLGGNLDRFRHSQLPAHVQHLAKTELAIINKLAHHVSDFFFVIKCYTAIFNFALFAGGFTATAFNRFIDIQFNCNLL